MDNGNINVGWCENNSITFKLKSISFPLKSMLYSHNDISKFKSKRGRNIKFVGKAHE